MKALQGRKLAVWALIVAGLFAANALQDNIAAERRFRRYAPRTPIAAVVEYNPVALTGVVAGMVLGGFRGTAATILWIKMDQYWHGGQWQRCYFVMRTITLLDPSFVDAWKTLAWHLMYNMPVEVNVPDPDMAEQIKQRYYREGIESLKEGISWNPDSYDLYFELGWNYFDKLDDYDNAAKWFRQAIEFEHPDYIERLLAHGYERTPEIDKALDWYYRCLQRYPQDHVAIGATLTIRERYLTAWRHLQAGDLDAAEAAINEYLRTDPMDTIGNRILATVFQARAQRATAPEARRESLLKALNQWRYISGTLALDSHAQRRVKALEDELGIRETPEEQEKRRQIEQRRRQGFEGPMGERLYDVPGGAR